MAVENRGKILSSKTDSLQAVKHTMTHVDKRNGTHKETEEFQGGDYYPSKCLKYHFIRLIYILDSKFML